MFVHVYFDFSIESNDRNLELGLIPDNGTILVIGSETNVPVVKFIGSQEHLPRDKARKCYSI